jgi:hypothetical protein
VEQGPGRPLRADRRRRRPPGAPRPGLSALRRQPLPLG